MLKRLRKRIKQRNLENGKLLAATICAAAVLTGAPKTGWADTGAKSFPDATNATSYTVTDNIITGSAPGLTVSSGVTATMSGTVTNLLSIKTSGSYHYGGYAEEGGITLTNVTVTTEDENSYGLYAINSGSAITMSGGRITTSGDAGFGAYTFDGGKADLTDVTITTAGDFAAGLENYKGIMTMTGGSITASGNYSAGASVGPGKTILTNVVITTNGTGNGVEAFMSGALTMIGGSITTKDASVYGAYSYHATIDLANVAIDAKGTALYATGYGTASGTINASVAGQDITGSGALLVADNYGIINLSASAGSQLYGTASVDSTSTAKLTLSSNATWTTPGDSILTSLELDGGAVAFTSPSSGSYKTLTVNNKLSGCGTFYLNANLTSVAADLISVGSGGTVSGSYQLNVRNWGGTPTSLYQTVCLTDLSSATVTGTFGGGSDVGIYRYGVARGSALSTAYTRSGSTSDYYLYNTFGPSTPVRAAMAETDATVIAWYGEMNDIRKRLGELRLSSPTNNDIWIRTFADKYNVKPGGSQSYSQIMRGLELGKDNPQTYTGGKKFTGFLVGMGEADNTYCDGGTGNINSNYLGAYVSWLKNDGAYIDLIGKYNWLHHSFDTPLLGGGSDSGSFRNKALGLSVEIGKHIAKNNGNFIEPQLELAALWSDPASYTTTNGLAVEVPLMRSLQMRLGCVAGRKWRGRDGVNREYYGKAAWVNEYAGDGTVLVNSTAFDSSLKGHQWVTGVGFVEDTGRQQFYLEVEKSWGNTSSKQWGVNVGYCWKF